MIDVTLETGVWQDDLGKHMRFAITELGVGITIDMMLPENEEQADDQAVALLAMVVNLPDLMAETLEAVNRLESNE